MTPSSQFRELFCEILNQERRQYEQENVMGYKEVEMAKEHHDAEQRVVV